MVHRVGIIGLGIMGHNMLRMMTQDDRFSVVMGMDKDRERMASLSANYPDMAMVEDANLIVATDTVDLVYIATPPTTHVAYATLALNHKKAVLCEKPLAVNLDDAAQLVQKAHQSNLPNAVNFPFATAAGIEYLENMVQSGDLGDPLRVDLYCHFSQWPRVWQQDAAQWLAQSIEGGYVREVVSHFMYLTHRLFGEIDVLTSIVDYPDENSSESSVTAVMNASGLSIRLMGGVGGQAPDVLDYTIYGTKKSYRLLNWRQLQVTTGDKWTDVAQQVPNSSAHLTAISDMLQGKPHPLADFAMGLQVQHTIEAILLK